MKRIAEDAWLCDAGRRNYFCGDVYEDEKNILYIIVKGPRIQFPIGSVSFLLHFIKLDHMGKVMVCESWEKIDG